MNYSMNVIPVMQRISSLYLEVSAEEAGPIISSECPIAAEGKIGNNWAEVH